MNVLGVSTNGPAVAAALSQRAEKLRERAQVIDDSVFDVAEWVVNDFSFREFLDDLMLRTNF
jgi:hypothetical protein